MSTPRRIVRLTRTVLPNGTHTLDAIADDGSAWWLNTSGDAPDTWTQIPALPPGEAQQEEVDADEPQTLHTIALGMVDSLGRSFNLLPEILYILRRAIREPMKQAATTAPEPAPAGGLVERIANSFGPEGEASSVDDARAAIWLAAAWLEDRGDPHGAHWLREEVQRHG